MRMSIWRLLDQERLCFVKRHTLSYLRPLLKNVLRCMRYGARDHESVCAHKACMQLRQCTVNDTVRILRLGVGRVHSHTVRTQL